MAMNKKEKAAFETLETELALRFALRFTEEVKPDLMPPKTSGKIINGYSFNSYNSDIMESCSSLSYHSFWGWNKTKSQGSIEQYSTKLLAMRALRNKVEWECAEKLRKIDRMIAKEIEGVKNEEKKY